jgi:endonuclease/exonuclease/phosphatase family metal-dependent hydrolase
MKATILALAMASSLAACDSTRPTFQMDHILTVMTRNVYPGMAAESIMAAPAEQIPLAAAMAWGKLEQTNFPERAGRLAAEILAAGPQVVGLQEVALYRVQLPGDAAFGGTTPATSVAFDFLQILLDTLAAHGAPYVALAADTTSDVEMPAVTGVDGSGDPTFMDIRYTDRDAILVRADVAHAAPHAGRYEAFIPFDLAGTSIGIYRGWGSVEATIAGTTYRFVNTHLDDLSLESQVGQATELLAMLADETKPVVLLGDFNSDAIAGATPTYGMLTAAGFVDLWASAHPAEPGASCCNAELLDNPAATYDQRIDLILVRASGGQSARYVASAQTWLVGTTPAERTASGLWPSDHAGLVGVLKVPE